MTLLSDDSERITKGEEIIISHKKEISNYICELWRDELKSKKKELMSMDNTVVIMGEVWVEMKECMGR